MGRLFLFGAFCGVCFSFVDKPFWLVSALKATQPQKSLKDLKAFGILMKSNQKPQGGEVSLSDFKSFQANKQEAYLR